MIFKVIYAGNTGIYKSEVALNPLDVVAILKLDEESVKIYLNNGTTFEVHETFEKMCELCELGD